MATLLPMPPAPSHGKTSTSMTGDLTLSGNLYEGNFEEWFQRLISSLRLHDLHEFADRRSFFTSLGSRTTKQAADIVWATVSPAIQKRVPERVRYNCKELIKTLQSLATPFRLLDLPKEVRNMIYNLTLPGIHVVHAHAREVRSHLPLLFRVSSQVRQEALMVFYCNTELMIVIEDDLQWDDSDREEYHELQRWSKSVLADSAKHLRSLMLYISEACRIRFKVRDGDLTLTFEGDEWNDRNPYPQELLNDHLKDVKRVSDVLDLQGQLIVLALLLDWRKWKELRSEIFLSEDLADENENEDDDEGNEDGEN